MNKIGFMQGRMTPLYNGMIQAFPWAHWREEFLLAYENSFPFMEWTLDQAKLYENPLMTSEGQKEIISLCNRYNFKIPSLTGDCFMQAPYWKENGGRRVSLLKDFENILKSSAKIGIKYVVIPLVDNGGLDNNIEKNNLFEGLDDVSTLLKDLDLRILFESDFSPDLLSEFIQQLDSNYFGINYDIGNSAALGYNVKDEFSAYGSRIYNVHVKDRVLGGTTVPLGDGNANFSKVTDLLKQYDYKGNYILQTARANNDNHVEVLCQYRDTITKLLT